MTWGNKFLMHAADPRSRSRISANLDDFSLRINKIHRSSIRIAEAISIILGDSRHRNIVPVPQCDPFEGLDHPYARPGMFFAFESLLEQLSKERDGWVDSVLGDLTSDQL
jgi:hypothetical protein